MLKEIYRKYIDRVEKKSEKIRIKKQFVAEWIEILSMLRNKPIKGVKLTKEQKNKIDVYWKEHYGKKIPYLWHKKYYAFSGKFDEKYIPEIFYTTKIEPKLNNERIAKVLSDKNLIENIFSSVLLQRDDIVIPKTIGGCANGYYYDDKRNQIGFQTLLYKVNQLKGKYILKPTIGSSSGQDVVLLDLELGIDKRTGENSDKIIKKYNKDFIIQEFIKQNQLFSDLHNQSINTIRIMSYRIDDRIKTTPAIMRIGVGDTHLDNAHAGGLYVGVSNEGVLYERAMRNYSDIIYRHPDSGICFKGYQLPCFDKIINAAKELHKCLPTIGIVSWDLTLNDKNQVVLIENNMICGSIWLFQNACGVNPFLEDTDYMIGIMKKK